MASMTTDAMRFYISEAYEGDAWKNKVKKMPDAQVYAVYMSILGKKKKEAPKKEEEQYRQMTIFDYI